MHVMHILGLSIAACMAVNEFHIIHACFGLDCKNPTRKPGAKNPQTGRKNPQTGAIFFSARFVVLMCTMYDVWVQLLSTLVQSDLRLSCTGYVARHVRNWAWSSADELHGFHKDVG